jgi:hypothetical protein
VRRSAAACAPPDAGAYAWPSGMGTLGAALTDGSAPLTGAPVAAWADLAAGAWLGEPRRRPGRRGVAGRSSEQDGRAGCSAAGASRPVAAGRAGRDAMARRATARPAEGLRRSGRASGVVGGDEAGNGRGGHAAARRLGGRGGVAVALPRSHRVGDANTTILLVVEMYCNVICALLYAPCVTCVVILIKFFSCMCCMCCFL